MEYYPEQIHALDALGNHVVFTNLLAVAFNKAVAEHEARQQRISDACPAAKRLDELVERLTTRQSDAQ
jgi:hypothetical protein